MSMTYVRFVRKTQDVRSQTTKGSWQPVDDEERSTARCGLMLVIGDCSGNGILSIVDKLSR